jgi:hypothetical protein
MKRLDLLFPASLLLFSVLTQVGFAQSQTSSEMPARDPQAVALLQQSVKAMGGIVPIDSVATGTVTTVAGSQTSQGTIRVLTRGTSQTFVQITMPNAKLTTVYSNGQANELNGSTVRISPLELVVTTQALECPLPLIAALLNDPDTSFQYIGLESSNGSSLQHIRAWDSFASQPNRQSLSDFSARDIWIDVASNLPQRISYVRRPAHGAVAGMQLDTYYTGYQSAGGTLYPSTIQKSMNGTPWATITIQGVTLNNGLTDADFPVQ